MQLSSRILTALAVLILAVAAVAVQTGSTGTVGAATGTINVLNVGTCYTTDTDMFDAGDCDDGDGNVEDTPQEGYNVAGRTTITKVDTVYATYAIDPKTSGDQPRAILKYSDVIKISIEDKDRDKRTGVLYAVGDNNAELTNATVKAAISRALGAKLEKDIQGTDGEFKTNSTTAKFTGSGDLISSSGLSQLLLSGKEAADHPMAPKGDGKVLWFGIGPNPEYDPVSQLTTETIFRDLTDEFIELDEDLSTGDKGSVAPWMRISAQVPDGKELDVQYVYYQTSEQEEIIGGKKKATYPAGVETPEFVDDEDAAAADDQDALVLHVSGDGNDPTQNLRLKEKTRFSGIYEGYVRLTDANGDGSVDDDENTDVNETKPRDDWGLKTKDAAGADMKGAAVIGIESGPITITYKNSVGDTKSLSVAIDKDAPSIQVDSPVNGTASTDDSPELIGTFTDGGGSGLRDDSFKIYADNREDGSDDTPVWDLRVLTKPTDGTNAVDRGYVCIGLGPGATAEDKKKHEDEDGCLDSDTNKVDVLSQYAGYKAHPTYGIIHSSDIYLDADADLDGDGEGDYQTADAETYEDGDANGEFDTIVRINFPPQRPDKRYDNTIDIQAVVIDLAGNIGFSDADLSDPTFIHDFGTKTDTATDTWRDDDKKHNVIGWFSRHVYYLDDVDPAYMEDQSATGYYLDANGKEVRNNSGAMVVFDDKLDKSTVGVGTFDVQLDDGTDATVVNAETDGAKVYLLLEEALAPNATPKVDLAAGQSISDLAGNESTDRRLDGIELNDGILPTFTVTLSGGTGLNEDIDGEGPSELTRTQMKLSISSDEAIQGAPQFVVVCSNLYWDNNKDDNDVAKFAKNRTGALTSIEHKDAKPNASHTGDKPATGDDMRTMCPDHTEDDTTYFDVARTSALRRAGNNWEYQWSNLTGHQKLEDGKLSVVVWGRDRSSYKSGTDTVYNYSATTSNFVLDTELMTAWDADAKEGELVPENGEKVFEVRPFVLLDFGDEGTTVDITTFKVDDADHTSELQILENNEFVWWPEPLAHGTYKVYVEANDAANNTGEHTYKFEVKERAPFVLNLLAGWNSVSFPANPVDRALHAVFTDEAVDQVVGWNVTEPVSPWRMATRVDGVWSTNDDYATLNDIEARYGYWVHSTGFITQAVQLAGKGDRGMDGQPSPADIPTDEGWNFVGVVDVDGDQTQDDAGETLRNSNNDPITAAEYLGNYTRAYTWDHVNNTWDVVKANEGITIGTGVWVYYTSDHDIAP